MAPTGRALRPLALTGTALNVAPDEEPTETFLTQAVRDVIDKTSRRAMPVPAVVPVGCRNATSISAGAWGYDGEQDWLRAGQALNRLLLHAASQWVFARLQTQPLQAGPIRALVRSRLAPPGEPQMLLEFGVARTAHPTARRPAADLTGA